MIKINLALRKQAAAIESKEKTGTGLSQLKFDAEFLKDPQIRKIGLAIIVAVMASYLLDGWKEEQLKALTQQFQKITAEDSKAKVDLSKTTGYDQLKKQFDADEEMIRTKLTTIQKLSTDRQMPPKLLLSLSSGIPKDVWLSELQMSDQDVKLKGYSLGFDQVTDFMKSLGENELVTDLKLDSSEKARDPIVGEVTTFTFEAKRK